MMNLYLQMKTERISYNMSNQIKDLCVANEKQCLFYAIRYWYNKYWINPFVTIRLIKVLYS